MDARSLRELELLTVTRLFGIGETALAAAAPSWAGLRVQVAEFRPRRSDAPVVLPAPWLFVGAADEAGDPFTGPAGKLFDAMLGALGCARGPGVDAAAAMGQVRPAIVVAMGKTAAARLLGSHGALESLRGAVHRCLGVALVVTLDPADLLASPLEKAKAWEDLVLARRTVAAP